MQLPGRHQRQVPVGEPLGQEPTSDAPAQPGRLGEALRHLRRRAWIGPDEAVDPFGAGIAPEPLLDLGGEGARSRFA